MTGTHAKMSPSGATRWMKCPGSVAAEAPYPDDSNTHAREGTAAHELASWCLEKGEQPEHWLGYGIHVEGENFKIDADMCHWVRQYVKQVKESNRDAQAKFVEVRVPIDHITNEEGAGGTSDFVGVAFKTDAVYIRVHDLKYGQGVRVEAEDNPQLVMYASGVIRELDYLLDGIDEDAIVVEMHIHQVRLDHWPVWRLTLAELREWETMLRTAAAACTPDAERVPGEAQCRFCKHRRACPELRALVESTVAEAPPEEAEAVAEVMPRLKMIRDWCATVEARAVELCEQNDPIICQHYKMVEGRRSKVWNVDEKKVANTLKRGTGLKQDDVAPRKLVSPAQALKLVPKEKQANVEKLIDMRPGRPTIAPIDDKRQAVNGADAMGFEDITQEETA